MLDLKSSGTTAAELPRTTAFTNLSMLFADASSSYKGGWSHATSPAPGQDACPHSGNAEEQAPPCVDANTHQPGYNSPGAVRDHLRGARECKSLDFKRA
ncbi:hypothetical protein ALC53_10808 [Atta colombica]|uniref:Uncharacterized protein n=1 Tax=Atta colombica TaxID=520822 RepID=A0A195B3I2_9HYME|nr:hypothetical protein ALC53_10808 [Atta colombica]